MLILAAIQAILAIGFILFGLVALFGIGITGLLFLVPGAILAATANVAEKKSRGAVAVALSADAALAYLAARKLDEVLTAEPHYASIHHIGTLDYLVPCAVLVLVVIAVLAVLMDWRALREASWF